MSSLLGSLTILISASTVGVAKAAKDIRTIDRAANAAAAGVNGSTKNINQSLMSIGRTMTQFVTLPLGIMGIVATKSFSTFEYNLSKVTGIVGIAEEQTKQWGRELLALQPILGKNSKELSEALYFVTTGGIRGAETMSVLRTAAEGAAIGLGETKDVADIVVSAMNAYGRANLSAAQAGDILVKSVREGKAEAGDLVKAMGVVFPIASKLGVSFDQVGAGMAAMTRTGTTASTSAVQLRRILFALLKPAKQAEDALRGMGTSSAELRNSLREDGLLSTLMELRDLTNTYGEEMMAKVFPNIRALAGVLDILGENLEDNKQIFASIAGAGGELASAFENVSETMRFKLNATLGAANQLMVKFGDGMSKALIPMLERLTERLVNLGKWFDNLSQSQQNFIIKIGGLLVIMGPLLTIFAAFYTLGKGIFAMFGFGTTAIAKQTAALEKNTAALVAEAEAYAAANTVATKKVVTATQEASIEERLAVVRTRNITAQKASTIANAQATASIKRANLAQMEHAKLTVLSSKAHNLAIRTRKNLSGITGTIVAQEIMMDTKLIKAQQDKLRMDALSSAMTRNKIKTITTQNAVIAANNNLTMQTVLAEKRATAVASENMAVVRQRAVSIGAENFAKQVSIKTTEAETVAVTNARHAKIMKMRADASAIAALKAETQWNILNAAALEKVAIATRNAAMAKSQFVVSTAALVNGQVAATAGSVLMAKNFAKTNVLAAEGSKIMTVTATATAGAAVKMTMLGKALVALKSAAAAISLGLGQFLGVILILSIALVALYKHLTKLTELEKLQKKVSEDTADAVNLETGQLKAYMAVSKNAALSTQMRIDALNKLKELSPAYLGGLSLETINTEKATKAVDAYTNSLMQSYRSKVLMEAMIETEKEYTKAVMTGADRKVTFWQKYWRNVQVGMGNIFALMESEEEMAERNAAKYKKIHEDKMTYLNKELQDRSYVNDQIRVQYEYLADEIETIVKRESQYYHEFEKAAEQTAAAIAKVSQEGKTEAEYLREIKKVAKDSQDAIARGEQANLSRIRATITAMEEQLRVAKEQADFANNMSKTDPLLQEIRLKIMDGVNNKELAKLTKQYDEQVALIEKNKTEILQPIIPVIEFYEEKIKELDDLIRPREVQIEIDMDVQKLFQDMDAAMAELERLDRLFESDSIGALEDKFKNVNAQLDIYRKLMTGAAAMEIDSFSADHAQKLDDVQRKYTELQQIAKDTQRDMDFSKIFTDMEQGMDIIAKKAAFLTFDADFDPLMEEFKLLGAVVEKTFELDTRFMLPFQIADINEAKERYKELFAMFGGEKGKVTDLWKDLTDALRIANREAQLFGNSYDIISEKLKIYEKALKDVAASTKTNLNDERVKNLQREYQTLKLAADAVSRLEKEERKLTDTFELQMEAQYKQEDSLRNMAQALMAAEAWVAAYELQVVGAGKSMKDIGLDTEAFIKFLDELAETPGLDPEIIARINEFYYVSRRMVVSDILGDLRDEMEDVQRKAEILGESFGGVANGIRVYENALSRLLRMNTVKFNDQEMEDYRQAVENTIVSLNKLKDVQMTNDLQAVVKDFELTRGKTDALGEALNILRGRFWDLWELGVRPGDAAMDSLAEKINNLQIVKSLPDDLRSIASAFDEMNQATNGAADSWLGISAIILNTIPRIIESIMQLVGAYAVEGLANKMREQQIASTTDAQKQANLADMEGIITNAGYGAIKAANTGIIKAQTAATNANTAASVANAAAANVETISDSGAAVAGAAKSGSKMPFPMNIIAIASGVAAVMTAISQISKAKKAAKMARGGVIPPGFPNDTYPAFLTSGETVTPPGKLPELDRQEIDVNVTVEGVTRGQDIYYVVKEVERRHKNVY